MKKLLPLVLTLLMLFLLIACNNEKHGIDNNDNKTSSDSNNSDETPSDDQSTKYELKTFSLTDEYGNAGTYSEIRSQYHVGSTIALEATVKAGYNFVGWFIGDVCLSTDLEYTFTMKSSNVEIEAKYNYYTIDTTAKSDDYERAGTYTQLKNKKISVGEQVTVVATVNAGYNFEGWFIGNVCVSEELSYSFVMKEKNVALEAKWSYYTVSVNGVPGAQGSFTTKANEKVSAGETVVLTATVANGYNFEGWYIGNQCACTDLTYSFVMKKENVKIEPKFSAYTVTVYSDSDGEGSFGTYTQFNAENVSANSTVTLIAEAAPGCNFEGWYVYGIYDGYWRHVCVCEDAEYTFLMGKEHIRLEARFSAYTVNTGAFLYLDLWKLDYITPGVNVDFFYSYRSADYDSSMGDYTQYKNTFVRAGEEVTLTATEKPGYTFLGWKRGFDLVSTNHSYTFIMDKSDIRYQAVYIKNP